eukprot:5359720-Pleurochrysis_carterae.AAC.1
MGSRRGPGWQESSGKAGVERESGVLDCGRQGWRVASGWAGGDGATTVVGSGYQRWQGAIGRAVGRCGKNN